MVNLLDLILLVLTTAVEIWLYLFSIYLISYDMFFTLFPTTFIGVLLISALLYQMSVPLPPNDIVLNIFGDPFKRTTSNEATGTSSEREISTVPVLSNVGIPRDRMSIVGHRGCGLDAPENTLIAFTKCADRGVVAVEFDVMFTKDMVPVIFHDDNLFRMTGIDRNIRELNYSELESVDLATKHPLANQFERPVRIPTLDEVIETCLEKGLKFFIDIKSTDSQIVDVILEAYKKYPRMYQTAIVTSFYPKIIYNIRRYDTNIVGSMAWCPCYYRYSEWDGSGEDLKQNYSVFLLDWGATVLDYIFTWSVKTFLWWFIGLSVICVHKDAISKEDVSIWAGRGLRVFTWTVNNPIEKRFTTDVFNIGYMTDTMDVDDNGPTDLNPSRTSEHEHRLAVAARSSDLFVTPINSRE